MHTKDEIRRENDLFRTTLFRSFRHQLVLTSTVAESPDREAILSAVRKFSDFSESNDPHEEHDFGRIEVNGEAYYFKFDYYDSSWEYGVQLESDDPIYRLLTIVHASEY